MIDCSTPFASATSPRVLLDGVPRPAFVDTTPWTARAQPACDAWFGADSLAHWTAPTAPPVPCRVRRQEVLVHEGAPARHLFIVQAGDFKVSRLAEDGYEQVLDFPGRNEMLCLDALAAHRCENTVTALEDALVYALPIADVTVLRRTDPDFDLRLQCALSEQWRRVGDVAWLMAAVGADRRTARFLVQMSRRMAARGYSPRRLRLRMSRRDIAAHLGLAHESISRAMTALDAAGLVSVRCRDVEITDLEALERFARSTRGHSADDAGEAGARGAVAWSDVQARARATERLAA